MLLLPKILTIGAGLLSSCWADPTPSLQNTKREAIDNFIATESPVALQGVLNNVGANGGKVPGAASGVVVASPSQSNPDCECRLMSFCTIPGNNDLYPNRLLLVDA